MKCFFLLVIGLAAPAFAPAMDVNHHVWHPRSPTEWVEQTASLADLVVRGRVGEGSLRVELRGHNEIYLYCWQLTISEVVTADRLLAPTSEVCVHEAGVPNELEDIRPGDDVVAFARVDSDNVPIVVLNVGLVRIEENQQIANLPGRGIIQLDSFLRAIRN